MRRRRKSPGLSQCDAVAHGVDLSPLEHVISVGWDIIVLYGQYILDLKARPPAPTRKGRAPEKPCSPCRHWSIARANSASRASRRLRREFPLEKDRTARAQTMFLEAHEASIKNALESLSKFKDVIQYLEEKLHLSK